MRTNQSMPITKLGTLIGSSLLAGALVLSGCGGDSDETTTPTTGTFLTNPDNPTASSTTVTSTPVTAPQIINIRYANGRVVEPTSRVTVKRNTKVQIRVDSDIAEEVHFHGYDLKTDVVPGTLAVIDFTANLPGSYEIEFESLRSNWRQLLSLNNGRSLLQVRHR